MDTKWMQKMKEDWNGRAKENGMHYIMTDIPEWNEEDSIEYREDTELMWLGGQKRS